MLSSAQTWPGGSQALELPTCHRWWNSWNIALKGFRCTKELHEAGVLVSLTIGATDRIKGARQCSAMPSQTPLEARRQPYSSLRMSSDSLFHRCRKRTTGGRTKLFHKRLDNNHFDKDFLTPYKLRFLAGRHIWAGSNRMLHNCSSAICSTPSGRTFIGVSNVIKTADRCTDVVTTLQVSEIQAPWQ